MKTFLLTLLLCLTAIGKDEAPTYTTKDYPDKHKFGLTRTLKSQTYLRTIPKYKFENELEPPAEMDLSSLTAKPLKQGDCGSCYAVGLTQGLRSAFMLLGKDPGALAINYILNSCGILPKHPQSGCLGGDFDAAENFLNGQGPWLDSEDPYVEKVGSCKKGLKVAATAIRILSVGDNTPSFKELASAISQRHYLIADVAVEGTFEKYASGIYNGSGNGLNHILNISGYNCQTSVDVTKKKCAWNAEGGTKNGDGYLILVNSWGSSSWGENGYMRIRWGANQVATTAIFIEVSKDYVPVIPAPIEPEAPINATIPTWLLILTGSLILVITILGTILAVQFLSKKKLNRGKKK